MAQAGGGSRPSKQIHPSSHFLWMLKLSAFPEPVVPGDGTKTRRFLFPQYPEDLEPFQWRVENNLAYITSEICLLRVALTNGLVGAEGDGTQARKYLFPTHLEDLESSQWRVENNLAYLVSEIQSLREAIKGTLAAADSSAE